MLDEVQCGVGRTGDWFAFQKFDLEPDVMALAKGLGGGMPIGACLASGKAASILEVGDHGTTFGGNPLACAAALAVLDTIEHQSILENVRQVGEILIAALSELGSPVKEIRGRGLMIGIELDQPIAKDVVKTCFDRKLIINATDETTLRLVPPLILTEQLAEQAVATLADVLGVKFKKFPAVAKAARAKPLHDVLSIDDLPDSRIEELLGLASFTKQRRSIAPSAVQPVENRTVAMVFEKPSLRTRVSFETAIHELGGLPVHLGKADIGMGSRESIRDVASNLSRWCAAIVARLYWHRDLLALAEDAQVPVINALTELEHPCQALADMLTIREAFGDNRVKITYVGDGNNVARSLAKLATRLGYPFTVCGPENFQLEPMEGLTQTPDLAKGLDGASVVYTDVWVSMGDEHEQEHRMKVFSGYQVDEAMMQRAEQDAIFLHCLPARRGYEVTDEVIDGPQSRVVDQAENRLHAQKALLQMVLGL
jgi:ornithine carbamoyltransferase